MSQANEIYDIVFSKIHFFFFFAFIIKKKGKSASKVYLTDYELKAIAKRAYERESMINDFQ